MLLVPYCLCLSWSMSLVSQWAVWSEPHPDHLPHVHCPADPLHPQHPGGWLHRWRQVRCNTDSLLISLFKYKLPLVYWLFIPPSSPDWCSTLTCWSMYLDSSPWWWLPGSACSFQCWWCPTACSTPGPLTTMSPAMGPCGLFYWALSSCSIRAWA